MENQIGRINGINRKGNFKGGMGRNIVGRLVKICDLIAELIKFN